MIRERRFLTMAKITRFYDEVFVPSTGREFKDIMNSYSRPITSSGNPPLQNRWIYNGTIDQVVISMTSGGATVMEVQVRYQSQVTDRYKLVYLFVDAPLPLHVDSNVDAPFGLTSTKNKEGDIHLYIEPDADCTLNIRLDIDIDTVSGL
jgi:hypothetical protein